MRLLGRFEVTVDGRIVPSNAWSRRRHAASLVKLLALTPGRRLHREQVIDALWPGSSVEVAAPRLRQAAHHVRRANGLSGSVASSGGLVMVFPEAEVRVDAVAFEAAAMNAAASGQLGDLREALACYEGELLPEDPFEFSWSSPGGKFLFAAML